MTISNTPHDEEIVDQLLLEADWEDAAELKPLLLELRTFAAGPPVLPSAKLATLMATGLVSLDARQRKRRRAGIVALVVVASMGMGTAAVAATDTEFRERAQETITTVIDTVTHGSSERPEPARSPGSAEAPGQAKEHPTPARDTPGRSGEENRPSSAPGEGNSGQGEGSSGQEARPSPKPGTPTAPAPGGGQGNAPAAPDNQKTGSRPSTASLPDRPQH